MKSIKIGILVAVAVIGVLAMAGSAQAAQSVWGQVEDAEFGGQGEAVGNVVTIWVENDTVHYKTAVVAEGASGQRDKYYVINIADLPDYPSSGQVFVSVQMFLSGTDDDGQPYDNDGCSFDEITKLEWIDETVVYMPDAIQSCSKTSSIYLDQKWNLISMPLKPVDNSTGAVLGGTITYDAVCRYNATSNEYESVMDDTMDPGTGYFVNVTSAGGMWTYSGAGVTAINEPLEAEKLNLVGWMDCNTTISGNLTSVAGNYNYISSWNATAQEFETYNPRLTPEESAAFNDFDTMEKGTGYFFSMMGADTLDESC